jgi:hypothetical protein
MIKNHHEFPLAAFTISRTPVVLDWHHQQSTIDIGLIKIITYIIPVTDPPYSVRIRCVVYHQIPVSSGRMILRICSAYSGAAAWPVQSPILFIRDDERISLL